MAMRRSKWLYPAALALTSATSATVYTALADDVPQASPRTASQPAQLRLPHDKVKVAQAQPTSQQLYLIRTTLLMLDTANRTGNYSVLRDSASPTFQQTHTAADLAISFQKVRSTVDLAAIAIRVPQLTRPVEITASKQLHMAGIVAGDPTAIAFEMLFDAVGGHWMLGALAVGPVQPARQRQVAQNSSRP